MYCSYANPYNAKLNALATHMTDKFLQLTAKYPSLSKT